MMLMLRIYCLQLWFDLSDGAAEDAMYNILPFFQFTDIRKYLPDRITITIINFRYFLEKHHACEQVLTRINDKLKNVDLMLRYGVIINATIISAPYSVKNKSRQRDQEIYQTRNGNQAHVFNMLISV